MEEIYVTQQIKQVIKEVEGSEKHIVRSPISAAVVAAEIIGDKDREVFLVMCLNTKNPESSRSKELPLTIDLNPLRK